jgi:hypothetical protein
MVVLDLVTNKDVAGHSRSMDRIALTVREQFMALPAGQPEE